MSQFGPRTARCTADPGAVPMDSDVVTQEFETALPLSRAHPRPWLPPRQPAPEPVGMSIPEPGEPTARGPLLTAIVICAVGFAFMLFADSFAGRDRAVEPPAAIPLYAA